MVHHTPPNMPAYDAPGATSSSRAPTPSHTTSTWQTLQTKPKRNSIINKHMKLKCLNFDLQTRSAHCPYQHARNSKFRKHVQFGSRRYGCLHQNVSSSGNHDFDVLGTFHVQKHGFWKSFLQKFIASFPFFTDYPVYLRTDRLNLGGWVVSASGNRFEISSTRPNLRSI